MKAELERIIDAIELAKYRVANLKPRIANDPVKIDALDDAELALGWAIKKVKKVAEPEEKAT